MKLTKETRALYSYLDQLLSDLGMSYNRKGRMYIMDLVSDIVMGTSDITDYRITKDGYPVSAKRYNSTPARIERSCRHAINTSFDDSPEMWFMKLHITKHPTVTDVVIALAMYCQMNFIGYTDDENEKKA